MAKYLVLIELPHYPTPDPAGDKRVRRVREFNYETVRAALEEMHPGKAVHSPLDKTPRGALIVTAFLSDNKEGEGRVGSGTELWAVGGGE